MIKIKYTPLVTIFSVCTIIAIHGMDLTRSLQNEKIYTHEFRMAHQQQRANTLPHAIKTNNLASFSSTLFISNNHFSYIDTIENRKMVLQQVTDRHNFERVLNDPKLSITLQQKIDDIGSSLDSALYHLNHCAPVSFFDSKKEIESLVNILDMKIPEPHLHTLLLDTKSQIAPYICDAQGTLRRPSEYEREKIREITRQFKENVDVWMRENFASIVNEVISPSSADRFPCWKNDSWGSRIMTNSINKEYLMVRDLCNKREFDRAHTIVKHHLDARIGKWLSAENTNHSDILSTLHHDSLSAYQRSAEYKEHIKATAEKLPHISATYVNFSLQRTTQQQQDLYDTVMPVVEKFHDAIQNKQHGLADAGMQEALSHMHDLYGRALQGDWQSAETLKQFSAYYTPQLTPTIESQIVVEPIAPPIISPEMSVDFITTANQVVSEPNNTEIRQTVALVSDTIESLQAPFDKALDAIIDKGSDFQNTIKTSPDMPAVERYRFVGGVELYKSVARTGKMIVHPVDTVVGLAQITAFLLYKVGFFASIVGGWWSPEYCRMYTESVRNDFTAVQKVLSHFYQLPNIDKFQHAIGIGADLALQHKLLKTAQCAKNSLIQSLKELTTLSEQELAAQLATQSIAEPGQFIPTIEKEVQALEQVEEALQNKIPSSTTVPEITVPESAVTALESAAKIMSEAERLAYLQKIEIITSDIAKNTTTQLPPITFLQNGNIIREFTYAFKDVIKYWQHIFSDQHIRDGIMNLGTTRTEIFNKIINKIISADERKLLQYNSDNTIKTLINGHKAILRCRIDNARKVWSIDGFKVDTYDNIRMLGNVIDL